MLQFNDIVTFTLQQIADRRTFMLKERAWRDDMAVSFVMAMALAAGTQGAGDRVDVAYEALAEGRAEVAIAQLEPVENVDDPARLINLAAAYAAQGRVAEARAAYERAAFAERYELETASGHWIDSRVLARQAIANIDQGRMVEARMASVEQ